MEKKNFKMISERLKLQPCPIGSEGFCCKICLMGPCRILNETDRGVCGASRSLINARNILRFAIGGASAHCGHANYLLTFLSENIPENYIQSKAPSYLYNLWNEIGILPLQNENRHFIEISEAIHVSTMGVNSDYQDILKWCLKIGIIDGYYGQYLATEFEDKKFGNPEIKKAILNLECINPDKINIAIHGHEPMLAEYIVKEIRKYKNINLIGVCCTGATLLAKHGIPLSAHFMLQEDVIATGVIDAMAVDIQCIMPSIAELCECYHTKLITTAEIARIPNAIHMPVKNETDAQIIAKKIIEIAIENKKNRRDGYEENFRKRDKQPKEVIVGFTEDNIDFKRFADMLKNEEIKGIIGVVGCVNPRNNAEEWVNVFKKLSKDYIIFTTGCMAFEFGKHNLLDGERFFHLGSCVNNSRIAEIFKRISEYLGKQINELPFLISAPMPIAEKSMAIALFFASLGCSIHSGYPYLLSSDIDVASFLKNTLFQIFKTNIFFEAHPEHFYNEINTGFHNPATWI